MFNFLFCRYIGSTNKWMDYEYRGGVKKSLNKVLSVVQGIIGNIYECFVAVLEFIFGQGKCDRLVGFINQWYIFVIASFSYPSISNFVPSARILLQNSLLHGSFRLLGLSTQDGIPSTSIPGNHNNFFKGGKSVGSRTWLFNLTSDPDETNNLALQFPDLVTEMRRNADKVTSKRAPQQKVWLEIRLDIFREKMLLPGICSNSSEPETILGRILTFLKLKHPKRCMFIGPWARDVSFQFLIVHLLWY